MALNSRHEPAVHNSLGLKALYQRLQDVATCDILDLGPVRSGSIDFWSQFGPSIFIADLSSSLPLPPVTEDTDLPGPDWHELLGLPEGRRFDVILAWDALNYLELLHVSGLIRYLSRFCKQGTIVFMMIFDSPKMPEKTTVYRIADESHLSYESAGKEMRTCPRHQPHALTQIMHQFRTSDSFRLRNGVIEYLFVYEG